MIVDKSSNLEVKKLPKKPLTTELEDWLTEALNDSDNWANDLLSAVGDTSNTVEMFRNETFDSIFSTAMNTPVEEKSDSFNDHITRDDHVEAKNISDDMTEELSDHDYKAPADPVSTQEFTVHLNEDNSLSSDYPGNEQEIELDVVNGSTPENGIIIASGGDSSNEEMWNLWKSEDQPEDFLNSVNQAVAEGLTEVPPPQYSSFDSIFDEHVLFKPMEEEAAFPSTITMKDETSNAAADDILKSAMMSSDINSQTVGYNEDPDWKPEPPTDQIDHLRGVKKVPMKNKVGRPKKMGPIEITQLPVGGKRGRQNTEISRERLEQLKYRRMRDLNNEASRKCRENRKIKANQCFIDFEEESKKNQDLREKHDRTVLKLEKLKEYFVSKFGGIPQMPA